jgi:hypothetical protein
MRKIILTLAAAGALAACATSPQSVTPGTESAHYDGCQAGYLEGGRGNNYISFRDEQRYAADDAYRKTWDKAYITCFDRAISEPRRR